MSLLERLRLDRVSALKAKDGPKAAFLSFVISEGMNVGKNSKPPRESTDTDVIAAIQGIIRRNGEAIELTSGADTNAAWQNGVLRNYLPPAIDEAQLTEIIRKIIDESGEPKSNKLMGLVMQTLKRDHNGEYNTLKASEIAKTLLSE